MASLDGLDWSVVDFSSNPVPGDPDKAEELADHYGTRGEGFQNMSDSLKKIRSNSAGLQGRWVERFDRDFVSMPEDFGEFSVSCSTVEAQVRAWALDMRRCQDTARLAYKRAKDARDRRARFQLQCGEQWGQCVSCDRELSGLSSSDGSSLLRRAEVERQRDAAEKLLDSYENKLADADCDYDQARKMIERVRGEYDDTALRHAAVIRAIDCTPKSVKGVERFYYSDGWQWVMAGVKVASFAAGAASFFVGGWFVAAVGAAAAAAQLVITGFKAYEKDASWIDFAFDGVSLVLAGMSLGKFVKETKALKTVRGRVGRLKRCAFGKSDALKTIQKNMDKALAKTNGVPVKVCKSFRRQEGWKSTVKRAFSDRRTQELFAKEFGNQFRKKVLEYRCYGF
ncbi:hypothetical protein [uncultured Bifidobacterium sp.]|uniref:hypothetical protein n=1 Tax=uncultured Bifidobacterium sp. TaxID=165187 RepID=UPI00280B88E5|nr:hypothetical protein [uncultured Bifidobacterium sp.]